jgi:hypothetical protein
VVEELVGRRGREVAFQVWGQRREVPGHAGHADQRHARGGDSEEGIDDVGGAEQVHVVDLPGGRRDGGDPGGVDDGIDAARVAGRSRELLH